MYTHTGYTYTLNHGGLSINPKGFFFFLPGDTPTTPTGMSGLSRFTSTGTVPSSSPVIDSMNSINVTPSLISSRRPSKQSDAVQGKYFLCPRVFEE